MGHKVILLLAAAAVLITACANPFDQPGHTGSAGDYMKGITFTSYRHDGYLTDEADTSLVCLTGTGAGWTGILKTAYQQTAASDSVYEDSLRTPADSAVIIAITRARQLGLKVFLIPHVDVADGTWRGMIDPADRDAWFASYRTFLVKMAGIARDHDADLFTVGCEFVRLNGDVRWFDLIGAVRQIYDGPLTYCANWDAFSDVAFWDRLDYIGIDWYVPLCTRETAGYDLRGTTLAMFLDELGLWADGRKIIFTEAGYPSLASAGVRPWDYATGADLDETCQAENYRILLEALEQRPWFAGIFWWEWDAVIDTVYHPAGYCPRGKPAERILRELWQ